MRVDQDLDLLYQSGFEMEKIRSNSPGENVLFEGVPSLSGWGVRNSWDEYLWCCYDLLHEYAGKSISERIQHLENKLSEAEKLYAEIIKAIGLLSQPDQQIYTSWRSTLVILKNKMS